MMKCETNDCRKEKRGCQGCFYSDEKEEKECEYCKESKKLLYVKTNYDVVLLDVYISNECCLWEKTYDIGIEIKYCPMCGRKLV